MKSNLAIGTSFAGALVSFFTSGYATALVVILSLASAAYGIYTKRRRDLRERERHHEEMANLRLERHRTRLEIERLSHGRDQEHDN